MLRLVRLRKWRPLTPHFGQLPHRVILGYQPLAVFVAAHKSAILPMYPSSPSTFFSLHSPDVTCSLPCSPSSNKLATKQLYAIIANSISLPTIVHHKQVNQTFHVIYTFAS